MVDNQQKLFTQFQRANKNRPGLPQPQRSAAVSQPAPVPEQPKQHNPTANTFFKQVFGKPTTGNAQQREMNSLSFFTKSPPPAQQQQQQDESEASLRPVDDDHLEQIRQTSEMRLRGENANNRGRKQQHKNMMPQDSQQTEKLIKQYKNTYGAAFPTKPLPGGFKKGQPQQQPIEIKRVDANEVNFQSPPQRQRPPRTPIQYQQLQQPHVPREQNTSSFLGGGSDGVHSANSRQSSLSKSQKSKSQTSATGGKRQNNISDLSHTFGIQQPKANELKQMMVFQPVQKKSDHGADQSNDGVDEEGSDCSGNRSKLSRAPQIDSDTAPNFADQKRDQIVNEEKPALISSPENRPPQQAQQRNKDTSENELAHFAPQVEEKQPTLNALVDLSAEAQPIIQKIESKTIEKELPISKLQSQDDQVKDIDSDEQPQQQAVKDGFQMTFKSNQTEAFEIFKGKQNQNEPSEESQNNLVQLNQQPITQQSVQIESSDADQSQNQPHFSKNLLKNGSIQIREFDSEDEDASQESNSNLVVTNYDEWLAKKAGVPYEQPEKEEPITEKKKVIRVVPDLPQETIQSAQENMLQLPMSKKKKPSRQKSTVIDSRDHHKTLQQTNSDLSQQPKQQTLSQGRNGGQSLVLPSHRSFMRGQSEVGRQSDGNIQLSGSGQGSRHQDNQSIRDAYGGKSQHTVSRRDKDENLVLPTISLAPKVTIGNQSPRSGASRLSRMDGDNFRLPEQNAGDQTP